MASLKNDFDTSFKRLLEKLNALPGEILLKCFGDNPNNAEKKKVSGYFIELQVEVSEKVLDLKKFQENLNSHCTSIHKKIGYTDLTGPKVSQGPTRLRQSQRATGSSRYRISCQKRGACCGTLQCQTSLPIRISP